eukprot:Opistho-2@23222
MFDGSRLLPTNELLSADTLILESGSTLSITGTLSANKHLEIVSGQDVLISGQILHKATYWDGSSANTVDALIDKLVITARGLRSQLSAIDLNNDGDTNDSLSEAVLGADYNGDGDLLDMVSETATRPTGNIDLQLATLPATQFELRAARDIRMALSSGLVLSGFVGGLEGFDSARPMYSALI